MGQSILSAASKASLPALMAPSKYPGQLVETSVPTQKIRPTGSRHTLP